MTFAHPTFQRVLEKADAAQAARVYGADLQELHDKLSLEVLCAGSAQDRMDTANDRLGWWMSAAQDDPNVCAAMKADIAEWFAALEYQNLLRRIKTLLLRARMEIAVQAGRVAWSERNVPTKRKRKGKRNAKRIRKT